MEHGQVGKPCLAVDVGRVLPDLLAGLMQDRVSHCIERHAALRIAQKHLESVEIEPAFGVGCDDTELVELHGSLCVYGDSHRLSGGALRCLYLYPDVRKGRIDGGRRRRWRLSTSQDPDPRGLESREFVLPERRGVKTAVPERLPRQVRPELGDLVCLVEYS